MKPQAKPIHKVLIFDSGAGGLSIAKEIYKLITNLELVYFADTDFFPYGNKPNLPLKKRIINLFGDILPIHQPDIVVIACNTASTLALHDLRIQFPNTTFVGTVPAIKPAAKASKTKHIGILATKGTTKSQYTKLLIEEYARESEVFLSGSCNLVNLAEDYLRGNPISKSVIYTEVDSLLNMDKERKIDHIVLACTHFPLLRKYIEEYIDGQKLNVTLVDSGFAIAQRVETLINTFPSLTHSSIPTSVSTPASTTSTNNQLNQPIKIIIGNSHTNTDPQLESRYVDYIKS